MAKTICLIDDEKDFTDLLGALLIYNGFSVETVNDPAGGLARVKEGVYDAFVVDLMMPGIGGAAVVSALRGESAHGQTPIFVLSAKVLSDEERAHLESQGAQFVPKPFNPKRMVELIRKAVG